MEKIAFVAGEHVIYCSSILVVLGALTAVFAFLALYLHSSGNWTGAMLLVPLAMLLGLLGARLLHWYGYPATYESLKDALTDFTQGSFALTGAMAGCLLAALFLRLLPTVPNLPQTLDCMSLSGMMGIAVGRLSALFNASNRGALTDGSLGFPLESSFIDGVTGQTEYRFATFVVQSAGCLCIFLGVLIWYLAGKNKPGYRRGDAAMLVVLLYSALEAVMDSTRYDSLYLRSNGFVSLVQILCVLGLLTVTGILSVRLVRGGGWHLGHGGIWLAQLALLGGAGYMEYYVQRHGREALFAYSIMGACLAGFVAMAVVLYGLQRAASRKRQAQETA